MIRGMLVLRYEHLQGRSWGDIAQQERWRSTGRRITEEVTEGAT